MRSSRTTCSIWSRIIEFISATKSGWHYVVVGHRHHIYYKLTPWVKDRHTYYYHGDAVSVFRVDEQDKGLTHCFILTFESETARDIYLPHPEHMRVVEENKPVLSDLLVVDLWGEE